MASLETLKKDKRATIIYFLCQRRQILIGNPADDITGDVLKMLNNPGTAPADSTGK
jgi:Skp family chaperone for outer membrane proteins